MSSTFSVNSLIHSLVTAALLIGASSLNAAANGDIFPAQPAAANAVAWKDGYFSINGKPAFITSGEMHYERIPRELWHDRIWRAKEMGFNCIQTYVFWNSSEPREGQWDFSDNLDLDAWLTAIQQEGMYAVVRVGPYCCAEWDQGGFPAWLTVKPGLTLRDSGELFDKYAYAHLDQVEKIVAKHQLNHGGNVIMVQLENEHPRGWGTDEKFPYLAHLVDQARANGLEIPVFLSGLHHGNDPSGNTPFTVGASPWYTTEFWTGWINKYGDMDPGMLAQKIAGTWKIIAFGGGGYDYYVVHGGTNFGYSGFTHDTTYDYSAPISENGAFNNFYAPAKRAAYFAQSFSELLTGSHNDPDLAKTSATGIRVSTRTNPTLGSFIMLDRFGQKGNGGQVAPTASSVQASTETISTGAVSTQVTIGDLTLPHQGAFNVETLEPATILVNVPWTTNAGFESVCTNVLLRQKIGTTDYWVCYGAPGASGEITLKKKGHADAPITFTYPADDSVQEIDLDSGDGPHAKLLVMNTATTAKTWLAQGKIYIGPSFVEKNGSVEFPPEGGKATIYAESGKQSVTQSAVQAPELPTLAAWTWRDAAPERSSDLKSGEWQQTTGPQPIGAVDSYQNRYAWYRTTLHTDTAGTVALHFADGPGSLFAAFLNGQPTELSKLNTQAGDNALAILVKAEPRTTLYNEVGVVNLPIRGIWGGVSTSTQPTPLAVNWKTWKATGDPGKAEDVSGTAYNDASWEAVDAAGILDAAKDRRWLRGTFTLTADQLDSFLKAPAFDKWKCGVHLNGTQLHSFSQDLSKLLVIGTNVIMLAPHEKGSDLHDLTINLWPNAALAHAPWFFHGGLAHLDETAIIGRVTNWPDFLAAQPWQKGESASAGLPAFWKTNFTWHPATGVHETLGLQTDGLRTGHVWLNGHNLGECPQKVPLYMPECWLKDGDNDLVIFDLYGTRPDAVKITRYQATAIAPPPKS